MFGNILSSAQRFLEEQKKRYQPVVETIQKNLQPITTGISNAISNFVPKAMPARLAPVPISRSAPAVFSAPKPFFQPTPAPTPMPSRPARPTFLQSAVGNIQKGIQDWAVRNPQPARAITNFADSIPSYPEQVKQNFQRANPISMFTQVAAPYAQHRVINPIVAGVKDIGSTFTNLPPPPTSYGQQIKEIPQRMGQDIGRSIQLGKGLFNIGTGLFNVTPAGVGFGAYDYAKAAKLAAREGKSLPNIVGAGKQAFTGEQAAPGLGTAFFKNPTAQTIGNIAELPLTFAVSHRLGGKEKVLNVAEENIVKARSELARQLGALEGDITKTYTPAQLSTAIKNFAGRNLNTAKNAFEETAIKLSNFINATEKRVLVNKPIVGLTARSIRVEKPIFKIKVPTQVEKTTPPVSDQDLISRLTQLIKEAKPLRGQQEKLYTKARGEKLAKMMAAREKMAGEKGFFEELGALKGELPKVEYEPVKQEFNQQNIDRLFNMIKENKELDDWEKLDAQVGLQKILGKEGGGVPTKSELAKLYKVYGQEFTDALLSKRPFFEKLTDAGMQLYNLPRSLMAGVGDFSATLMQNILFAYRHPLTTTKNFVSSVKMFRSENFYKTSMEEIASRPTYKIMKQAKVHLTGVSPIMTQREEQFMSSWAEKIPGLGKVVRATGRAWTGFLNKMRGDVFDQIIKGYEINGGDIENPQFLKSLGEFVNAGTGRGSLGQLEKVAPVLAQGLFSARKLAALGQTLNPFWYINADPFVRKEALKTMAAFIGGGMTIVTLADLAGADVGKDPTSTDFGKIKIGNTRFNVFGTYQQVAVLLARLYMGYATSSTTGKKMVLGDETAWRPLNRFDLITRFFESKEHPTLSLIIEALKGQTNMGQPFDAPSEVLSRFIPMVLGDSYDLYKEHGPVGLLGSIPMILGIPTQTYGSQYPVVETTPAGNPKIKLKPETDLAKDILLGITGQEKSNIPEDQQQFMVSQLQQKKQQEEQKETDIKRIQPIYDELQIMKQEGRKAEADAVYYKLSKEYRKIYDGIKSSAKRKRINALKIKMYPLVKALQEMKKQGRKAEADKIYFALPADSRTAYTAVKKELGIDQPPAK